MKKWLRVPQNSSSRSRPSEDRIREERGRDQSIQTAHSGQLPQQVDPLAALDRLQRDLNATNENVQRQSEPMDHHRQSDSGVCQVRYGESVLTTVSPGSHSCFATQGGWRSWSIASGVLGIVSESVLTKEEIRQVEAKLWNCTVRDVFKPGERSPGSLSADLKRQRDELIAESALSKHKQVTFEPKRKIMKSASIGRRKFEQRFLSSNELREYEE